jgi:aminoglycoside/choline kinase family phosphotransferase
VQWLQWVFGPTTRRSRGRLGSRFTMDILKKLFEQHFRSPLIRVQPLQGHLGGSGRTIVRLIGENATAIGIRHNVREENVAFIEFSRHFRRHGLPVPQIYAEDLNRGAYLEEDLGDTTLFEFLSQNRAGAKIAPEVIAAYRKVVDTLPRFQIEAGRDLNYSVCCPRGSFDRQSIAWDLNYFKYYFLKLSGIPFSEQALEDDFDRLTDFLLSADCNYFLYRDFQSRNVMMPAGEPYFLDYQGGRKGALHYDIASLLYDAKADLPPKLREQLLDHYIGRLADFIDVQREGFMRHYYAYVYVRIMQALGAYGFRGFYERKPHFLQSVPYALKNLRWLLQNAEVPVALPALMNAFKRMSTSEKLLELGGAVQTRGAAKSQITEGAPTLTVRIFSFSFHQGGPPKDAMGHGGGFVFDARGIPNPGREARFKALTGKDAPVIEYLAAQPSAQQFLAAARAMVEASVSSYQQRGFTDLMVSFGCTGGQHRSVYLAEQLTQSLRAHRGVQVVVRHLQLEKMEAEKLDPAKAAR